METKDQIIVILETARIHHAIRSAGTDIVRNGWNCDGWCVTLTHGMDLRGYRDSFASTKPVKEEFDFFTGLGLRKKSKGKGFPDTPKTPHIADVLHSLIMDSEALNESFTEWCANYGMNDDSIKSFDVYRACCENAKRLTRVIPRDVIGQLRELLQEY